MGSTNQSGIFYTQQEKKSLQEFPKGYRRGFLSRFERKFTLIFAILILVSYLTVGLLSTLVKEKTEPSEKEILKIQERYAQLVLNQPKPKVEEKVETKKAGPKVEAEEKPKEEEKPEEKVNREKESFVEKEQRKEAGSEVRKAIREQVAKQVQSSGIFAAITATGSGGGGGGSSNSASDLLGGAGDGIGDISNINISKGTFATKKVDQTAATERKGSRTTDVGIQREAVGRAEVAQVATNANVNITSAPAQITGESSSNADRSQAAIGRIVSREAQRLKRVYEDWLKRDPALTGRLAVKFTILPDGSVSLVSIVKSTTNNQDFDDAILRYIKRWQFPAVPNGGPVEVVYPFVFEGQS
jgi:TonB family protein